MNSLTLQQHSRPIKVAFLVNKDSYLEAMQINSALWGGQLNPLVPVKVTSTANQKQSTLNMLADFDVDIIVNMTKHTYKYIEDTYKNGVLRKVIYRKNELFGQVFNGTKKELKLGMSMLPVFGDIWNQNKIQSDPSSFSLIKNTALPQWNPMLTAVFGTYPATKPLSFGKDYQDVIKPKIIEFNVGAIDQYKLYEHGNPLSLTVYDLEEFGAGRGSMSSHVVYIGRLQAWEDLVEFWNLRAAGKEIVYLPYEFYKEFKLTVSKLVDAGAYQINPQVQNSADLLSSPSITDDELNEVGDWIRADCGRNIPRRNFRPYWHRRQTMITQDIAVSSWRTSEKEESVTYDENGITPFYLSYPQMVAKSRSYRQNGWANVLSFNSYRDDKYCFSFPIDPAVEELVQRSLNSLENSRLSNEGVIVFSSHTKERVFGSPIETIRIIEAVFKTAGFTVSVSQPGRITQNLINFLGGIWGCRLLKVDGIRKVLRRINKEGALNTQTIVGEIARNWHSEDNDDLVLKAGGLGHKLDKNMAFDALVKSKLVRPGLTFSCSQCGEKSWYSVEEFTESYKCHFCFLEQDVPRLDRLKWAYTTNGLARIKDEGYGSLPVILSLWRLDHLSTLRNSQGITSIEVKSPKLKKEIDYIYLATSNDGEYELVLGEAKGYETINATHIARMRRVAECFNTKPYLAFSTLKDELSIHEKNRLKALVAKGFPVIIFTRKELEPYDLFDRFDSLKNKYATSLSDLAENTQQLNLA